MDITHAVISDKFIIICSGSSFIDFIPIPIWIKYTRISLLRRFLIVKHAKEELSRMIDSDKFKLRFKGKYIQRKSGDWNCIIELLPR